MVRFCRLFGGDQAATRSAYPLGTQTSVASFSPIHYVRFLIPAFRIFRLARARPVQFENLVVLCGFATMSDSVQKSHTAMPFDEQPPNIGLRLQVLYAVRCVQDDYRKIPSTAA